MANELEPTFRNLATLIGNYSGEDVKLHTIQYVASDYPKIQQFQWFTLSKDFENYSVAVNNFLRVETLAGSVKKVGRTMVGNAPEDGVFAYAERDKAINGLAVQQSNSEFVWNEAAEQEWADVTTKNTDSVELFNEWVAVLHKKFNQQISVLWVSVIYEEGDDSTSADQSESSMRVSSMFLLLEGHISEDKTKGKIASLCQRLMVTQLVGTLRDKVRKALFERDVNLIKFIADAVTDADVQLNLQEVLKPYASLLLIQHPILIVGEVGAGKIKVAELIHKAAESTVNSADSSDTKNSFNLIDLADISQPRQVAKNQLLKDVRKAEGGTVVFDNLDLATPQAQRVLVELLIDQANVAINRPADKFPPIKPIFVATLNAAGYVPREKFIDELWYRLSPFTIRLNSVRELGDDIEKLFQRRLDTAFAQLSARAPKKITLHSDAKKHMNSHMAFRGNFREITALALKAQVKFGLRKDKEDNDTNHVLTVDELKSLNS
jgi:transcriptional regulator of aromatic amino acid metabolism